MKIVNDNTGWESAGLRAIVQRVVKEMFTLTPEQRASLVVTFAPGKHLSGGSGTCYIGRLSTVKVFIASVQHVERARKEWPEIERPLVLSGLRSVAMVVAHEIMHGLGHQHKDVAMHKCPWFHDHEHEMYSWADTLVIAPQAQRSKPRPKAADKLAKAEAAVKKYQTKVKRDTTLLKKWQRKAKYYRKQIERSET